MKEGTNMYKKTLSWMLVIAMMLAVIPFSTMTAYAAEEGEWTYTLYDGDTTAAGFTTPTWRAGFATFNTVELSAQDTEAPIISGQSVWRNDTLTANVRFMSSEAGTYYYIITDENNPPSTDDISGWTTGTAIAADTTVTFSPLNLTAGENYLHLVVKDSSDNVSDVLTFAMPQEYYYFENFEVYPLDTTIASGELAPITQINNGTGNANQKVTAAIGNASNKVLHLSSKSSWASDQVVLLDESALATANKYVFEGDVYALGTTGWQLRFSVTNGGYGPSSEAGVFFKNGNIVSISDSERVLLTGYIANKWYNVKIEANPSTHTYAVYVDGILLDNTLTLPSGINRLAITSGHGFTAYYDNLKFYAVPFPAAHDIEPGTIQFEASSYGTYEGYNGWIRVERIDGSDGVVSVDYSTVNDTAVAGVHYTPASGTLTWSDGDSESKIIPITIANDSQYNGYLNLLYTLSNPTGGAELGTQNPLIVKISDNDNPPTPTGFTASAANGSVVLNWDEVNSAYYKLYYSTVPGSFTEENSVGIYDSTSYIKTELTNGTTYYFALKAGHDIYYSELTDSISATPKDPSSSGGGYISSPTIIVVTLKNDESTTNSTTVSSYTVSGTSFSTVTTAILDAVLDKISSAGGNQKNDLIELSIDTKADIDELKVTILQKDLAEIIDETDAGLGITSPFISILFDDQALETISAAESGGTVVISGGIIDNDSLSEADKVKVQGRPVYDLTIMNGGTQVSNFNGGQATVTIPYTLQTGENPNAFVIYYLADDGTLKAVRGHYDASLKAVVFKTTHFNKFVIGYNPVSFNDVAADSWYKNAVDFIAAREIISGTGNNMFNPEAKLTRAQFVVLLMNAYQISTQNQGESSQILNFADAGNSYYTDYLLSAKALGIVNGVGNNVFAPEKEITRQEMFVMLYNTLKGIDEIPAFVNSTQLSRFNDADKIAAWANEAISSLVKTGTVEGYNNNLNPTATTTRAEITQVLYKLLSK